MTERSTEMLYFSVLIIVFCQSIYQVNTLRCAHACPFGPISLGSIDPIKTPCNTVDINITDTVCSVVLTINFETSFIRGTLHDKPRLVDKSSTLDLKFTLFPTKTITFIDYYCATTDDCDQEFVRETVSSSKWFQFNETKVRTDINSVLFNTNSSTTDLICANNLVCSWNEHCHAQLIQNSSSSQLNFNNNFLCDSTSSSQINFERQFNTPSDDQVMKMEIYCNKDGCNQQKTVEQVHNIFQNDFNLPLNYSAYTPKPNGSHRIISSIKNSAFLFFIFIYLTLFLL